MCFGTIKHKTLEWRAIISYAAFYNQPYIFTKKCDKNIVSSKLYPESSNDEDINAYKLNFSLIYDITM